jgi:hypothetical protein
LRVIRWMKSRRCSDRTEATTGTTHFLAWNGCENRFLVANCQVREQYDTRFVQARSRVVVSKRTP